MISVVIPTLDPGPRFAAVLSALVPGAVEGLVKEVVVADAGSTDGTLALADEAGCRIVLAQKGRGVQLRAGAEAARGDWFLFLHADSVPEEGWMNALERRRTEGTGTAGYFDLRFDDPSSVARLWEFGVGFREGLLGLPYGDQGLFISRSLYEAVGGYPPWPLMEDVEMVRRLGRKRLRPLGARVTTSAERYRRQGWIRRTAGNWSLLARYWMGTDPSDLARRYG